MVLSTFLLEVLMKQTEFTLLCSYIYNNRQRLEDEISQMQTNLRFRKIDLNDCIELALAKQRLETFVEVTGHIIQLLNLGGIYK